MPSGLDYKGITARIISGFPRHSPVVFYLQLLAAEGSLCFQINWGKKSIMLLDTVLQKSPGAIY